MPGGVVDAAAAAAACCSAPFFPMGVGGTSPFAVECAGPGVGREEGSSSLSSSSSLGAFSPLLLLGWGDGALDARPAAMPARYARLAPYAASATPHLRRERTGGVCGGGR